MNSRNPCTGKCDWTGVVESTQPTTGNVERYPMCKACGSFVVGSAALSAPVAVTVGPLVWGEPYLNEINETAVNAHSSCGRYIASDHGWFLCGLTQWNEAGNIESAKAAAQADYEQRIRSALIATPRPLPSRDDVARLIVQRYEAPSRLEVNGTPIFHQDAWQKAKEAATAILTLLGGSAHG